MKYAFIIAAAPENSIDYILKIYNAALPELVICADGGSLKAAKLGIKCDVLMGDMDSGGAGAAGTVVKFPAEKNYTDTEACLAETITRGFANIIICGASGGRIDHTLCNINLLSGVHAAGVNAILVDDTNILMRFKNGAFTVPNGYKYFSIIPISSQLGGVTLSNCKYPLENATVLRSSSLTVSNEPKSGEVSAEIKSGNALLIFSK